MNIFESLLLGVVQGVTEFLPVSSFGHLVVLQHLMDLPEVPVLYDILLHTATLAVIMIFFRRRVIRLAAALYRALRGRMDVEDRREMKTVTAIGIGTAVTGVIGLGVRSMELHENETLVFALFIVTGIILLLGRFIIPTASVDEPRPVHGFIIGAAQGIGTLPGISRSGITITAALISGVSKEKAGELSFLLSIPAILGALVLEVSSAAPSGQSLDAANVIAGMAASVVAGFFSLSMLMAVIKTRKLHYFSAYLIPLGIIGLALL
jgi:undecaprenyl-diphosphatase